MHRSRDLAYRIGAVVPFLRSHNLSTPARYHAAFTNSADSSVVGVFVQITNDQGALLYQSDVLQSHHLPVLAPGPADGSVTFASDLHRGWPVRFSAQTVNIGGENVQVRVIEPLRDTVGALREFQVLQIGLTFLALFLLAVVGYGLSRHALAPVDQLREQADRIDPGDLTTRLRVPDTNDELARLAKTLNAMLHRIETGYHAIEQFTADASHELRAPLALITTAIEVSLRREMTREELKQVLQRVLAEARHMSSMVQALLDLARGNTESGHRQLGPVDVSSILCDAVAEIEHKAFAKGLIISADVEQSVYAIGDSTDLRRLFLILMDNAVKYTEQGSVQVTLCRSGDMITARVTDTGIGIHKDALGKVFDRFWRADESRSRSEGGAGLGLTLAAQIVERCKGSIAIESEPGKGTTFTVRFIPAPNPGPPSSFASDD